MKKIKILLILLILMNQAKSQYNLKSVRDAYSGKLTISTADVKVGEILPNGTIKFRLSLIIEKDTSLQLGISINRLTRRCLNEDSRLQIRTDHDIYSFRLSGQKICSTKLNDFVLLNLDTLVLLTVKDIKGIRVLYNSEYDDFEPMVYPNEFFKKSVRRFKKNYPGYFIRYPEI